MVVDVDAEREVGIGFSRVVDVGIASGRFSAGELDCECRIGLRFEFVLEYEYMLQQNIPTFLPMLKLSVQLLTFSVMTTGFL